MMREDMNAVLKKFNVKTFGNKKNIERVESMLSGDERVLYIAPTNAVIKSVNTRKMEKLPGVFTLTDKRILFVYKAGFSEAVEIIPLMEIHDVNCAGNGLTGGHVTIHTMTKTLDVLVTYKKEVMKEIQRMIYEAAQACRYAENAPASQNADGIAQIEKLHDLFQKGIITEEEFTAKKMQILDL